MSRKMITTSDVINKFVKKHGDHYDYSKVVFSGYHTKVSIVCPVHGEFKQTPAIHLRGSACRECGYEKRGKKRRSTPGDVIARFKSKHGDRYDYTNTTYTNNRTAVTVSCSEHGAFEILPDHHLRGGGCRACALRGRLSPNNSSPIDHMTKISGGYYDYSKFTYHGPEYSGIIVCPEHGEFEQSYVEHVTGGGCPNCRPTGITEAKGAFLTWISELDVSVEYDSDVVDASSLVDVYLPDFKLAIDYCGLHQHSERMGKTNRSHSNKMEIATDKGIEFVTMFEDEWLHREQAVRSIILNKLGRSSSGTGARKTVTVEISTMCAKEFLEEHHIQGFVSGSVYLGSYYDDTLIAVMVFGNPTRQTSLYEWELKRFATNGRVHPGVMGKLFKHFLTTSNPESIVSFSDQRWFSGKSYQLMGFHKSDVIPPDYYYHRDGLRHNKSGFRKARIAVIYPEIFDATTTERDMMELAGYDRIWDCGKIRWVWTNPELI